MVASIGVLDGFTVFGEGDAEDSHGLADDDLVKTFLEWVVDILDIGGGDLVELMEVWDAASDDFGDETTDWDGTT